MEEYDRNSVLELPQELFSCFHQSATCFSYKSSGENVDILGPDLSNTDSQIVQNGYSNFNSDCISENDNWFHSTNFENIQAKDTMNIQQPENTGNGLRRAKFI